MMSEGNMNVSEHFRKHFKWSWPSMSKVDPNIFRLCMFSNTNDWLVSSKIFFFVTFLVKRLLHLWSTVITFVVKAYYICGRYYICGQLLHLWLLQLSFGSMLSLAATTGKLKFICYISPPFYLFHANFFSRDICLSRGTFLYLSEGAGHANRSVTPPVTTYVRHLNDFSKIF